MVGITGRVRGRDVDIKRQTVGTCEGGAIGLFVVVLDLETDNANLNQLHPISRKEAAPGLKIAHELP